MLRVESLKPRTDIRKRSVVWRFFKTVDVGSVQCLLCSGYLSRPGQGTTSAMLRHLRVKHPKAVAKKYKGLMAETTNGDQDTATVDEEFCSVEVALEDGDSDTPTTVDESNINSSVNSIVEASQEDSTEQMTVENTSNDHPVKHTHHKRSLIWKYFDRLDGLAAARCRICIKKLQCCEGGGTSNLRRHMSSRHPVVFSSLVAEGHRPHPSNTATSSNYNCNTSTPQEMFEAVGQKVFSVEVALEDGDSDTPTTVDESDMNSSVNSIVEASQEDSTKQMTVENTSNDHPVKYTHHKRSLIWRYYDRLDGLDAVRCRICMKKLQCCENGGISNLRRHMSNRHPDVFSSLVAEGHRPHSSSTATRSNSNCNTSTPQEMFEAVGQKVFSGSSDREKRAFRRERELIEALRRAQKEEAQALEHQRELIEKLRAVDVREAAAERENIESLRKAQQEEAKDLSRQREELQNEKAELQKKWEELQQEREELLLFHRGQ